MRSLLYVDLTVARREALRIVGFAVLMSAIIILTSMASGGADDLNGAGVMVETSVAAGVAIMASMMLLFTLFGMDGNQGWAMTRLTLPVTRSEVVRARYVFVALASLAMSVFGMLLGAAFAYGMQMLNRGSDLRIPGMGISVALVMATLAAMLLFFSVQMPVMFRWGINAGRYSMAVFWLIPVLCSLAPVRAAIDSFLLWTDTLPSLMPVALAVFGVGVALYLVSMAIAQRLYATSEL